MNSMYYLNSINYQITLNKMKPYFDDFMNKLELSYLKKFHTIIQDIINFPYEDQFNLYKNNAELYINNNFNIIVIIGLLMCFLILCIILLNQYDNILKIGEIKKLHNLEEANLILIRENKELRTMIDRYRSLRTNKEKGFFIIKGSPSNRLFRKMIKEKNGRYLGNGEYLISFKHYNHFDKDDIIY